MKSTHTRSAPIYLSLQAGALTLSLDGKVNLSFDGEGRLIGAFLDGITYRRALDNRVLAKWRATPGARQRRFLDDGERRQLMERSYAIAQWVRAELAAGRRLGNGDLNLASPSAMAWLELIAGWDWERLEAERARFAAVYKPIPILPPDQYLSLVVQVTEGCSYNECSFCTFYRDRPFRIKRPDQVGDHLQAIQRFLGRGLTYRRAIFLADANAVVVAQRQLLPILQTVNQAFDGVEGWSPSGLYAFVSAPDALHKSAADFAQLRDHNLRRVYVGLETGHDPLRTFLRKPGGRAGVLDAVRAIKAGGVDVGLIFMVGVGGDGFREGHFQDTVALIQQMPLDRKDLLYLSPFFDSPGSPYSQDAAREGIIPFSPADLAVEQQRFQDALRPWAKARGVRLSRYDIREFIRHYTD